ncbi:MAG: glycosyl hydrolase, partial [Clostridia bacterium]|nr:glycosyl hydrolase [Clostridia bacterium]
MEKWYEQAWGEVCGKLEQTAEQIGASYPHVCKTDVYDCEKAAWWTNGFWPGILWLAYRETKEEGYAR